MAEKINDGGPAFPRPMTPGWSGGGSSWPADYGASGMSLRDWFAGQALAGLMGHLPDIGYPNPAAKLAYALADAMLAERAKGGSHD